MPDIKLPRYMIGTTAYHKLGDLSRSGLNIESVCCLTEYDPETKCYIGAWVTGFGFYNVHFPADTLRELTEAELIELDGKVYELAGNVIPGPTEGERIRKVNN